MVSVPASLSLHIFAIIIFCRRDCREVNESVMSGYCVLCNYEQEANLESKRISFFWFIIISATDDDGDDDGRGWCCCYCSWVRTALAYGSYFIWTAACANVNYISTLIIPASIRMTALHFTRPDRTPCWSADENQWICFSHSKPYAHWFLVEQSMARTVIINRHRQPIKWLFISRWTGSWNTYIRADRSETK